MKLSDLQELFYNVRTGATPQEPNDVLREVQALLINVDVDGVGDISEYL